MYMWISQLIISTKCWMTHLIGLTLSALRFVTIHNDHILTWFFQKWINNSFPGVLSEEQLHEDHDLFSDVMKKKETISLVGSKISFFENIHILKLFRRLQELTGVNFSEEVNNVVMSTFYDFDLIKIMKSPDLRSLKMKVCILLYCATRENDTHTWYRWKNWDFCT